MCEAVLGDAIVQQQEVLELKGQVVKQKNLSGIYKLLTFLNCVVISIVQKGGCMDPGVFPEDSKSCAFNEELLGEDLSRTVDDLCTGFYWIEMINKELFHLYKFLLMGAIFCSM